MWLRVVSRSSDYWLGISPHVSLIALVEVEVCLGIPSCGTCWVPRGSRGMILGSTGRGSPLLYPASVFPTRPMCCNHPRDTPERPVIEPLQDLYHLPRHHPVITVLKEYQPIHRLLHYLLCPYHCSCLLQRPHYHPPLPPRLTWFLRNRRPTAVVIGNCTCKVR